MANTKTTNLTCGKCKETKSADEFYKCSRRHTGKQASCKICSKKINAEFRNANPNYYWGDDTSYFRRNYIKTMKYHADYQRADKNGFIYKINTSKGIYIGCSKANPSIRKSGHKNDFLQFLLGKPYRKSLPIFFQALLAEGDNWVECLKTFKIIEVLPLGTSKEKMFELETYWIQLHKKLGYNLLNKNKVK
jgi:hypothetical protein